MSETKPQVVYALTRKRAEIAGDILVCETQLDRLRLDMSAIDRALVMFDPDAFPADITPVVRRPRGKRFRFGAWSAAILNVMRETGKPMDVRAIAGELMRQEGIEPNHRSIKQYCAKVRAMLVRQKPSVVVSEWTEGVTMWRIADDNDETTD